MIRIKSITPVNVITSLNLEELEPYYLEMTRQDTSPYQHLHKLIHKRISTKIGSNHYRLIDFDSAQQAYLIELYDHYDSLIKCTPENFETLKIKFDLKIIGSFKQNLKTKQFYYKFEPFGEIVSDLFGYTEYFRTKKRKGIWYAEKLNIRSCPYCNANYTHFIRTYSNERQAKFQFDHFYPKKRYPYFSLSMYNLIPSCASCNQGKSDSDFKLSDYYHPYFSDIHNAAKFYLKHDLSVGKMTMGEVEKAKIEVKFRPRSKKHEAFTANHDKMYNITGIYQRLDHEARRILKIAVIEAESRGSALLEIKGLFDSIYDYQTYALGNSILKTDILNKPFSKFNIDLAKQFNLIK